MVTFFVWEIVDYVWLIHRLPAGLSGELDTAVMLTIVVAISGAVFGLVGRYQKAITKVNADLTAANAALSKLEAARDARLLELARDLSFAAFGLAGQAELALQRTIDLPNIKALSDAVDRAEKIGAMAHALLDLKEMAETPGTPRVMEKCK
jgi:hypothetical protein